MPPVFSREFVLKKLRDCFPDQAVAQEALKSLEHYGNREWHINKDIVHLAILKLSGGALWRLRDYVKVARRGDFRDVILLARCPEGTRLTKKKLLLLRERSPKLPSAAQEAAVQKRDRAQWEAWLYR